MRVVVTGAGGHFARALLPLLVEDGRFSSVVGLDVNEPKSPVPGVQYHQLDVRSRRLALLLDGADVLIHLAFVIYHRGDRQRAEEVNVDGSIQVFEMAARRGVRRILAASSHAVYGAHRDNPVPINETWPRRGNRELHYSWAKRLIEEHLDTFELRYPDVELVRLRPCTVWGPGVPPNRAQLYLSSIALAARRYDAPIQLLDETDVANAFVLAATAPGVRGAFNLAPQDWIRPSKLRRRLHIRAPLLPSPLVRLASNLMWRMKLSEVSPKWLLLARHPVVLSNRLIRTELGWRPTRTTVECARETLAVITGESPALD
jgi:nucleoside-diphosphate-sugar epimerase